MDQREFWDRCHHVYDALNELDDYRGCLDRVIRAMAIAPGRRVLDAGSGTGNLSIPLRRAGARVTSMDFSGEAIRAHRAKDPGAEVIQASLEEPLPFGDAEFDGVACLSVLFAISRPGVKLALREFRRVLKPGGLLVVTAMRPGQSKIAALAKHFAARARLLSFFGFARELLATAGPLLGMLYYNIRMYALRRRGGYHRFSRQELLAEIGEAGFVDLGYDTTYGGRFHLVTALAPVALAPRPQEGALRPAEERLAAVPARS
jgi:ubiquinone/menaquinone biosynthesis C-methylase UbiE